MKRRNVKWCLLVIGLAICLVSLVVANLVWRCARCSEGSRYPLSDSVFDICPEMALKVVAVRGLDERNDYGQEDVIYLDLSYDIDIICGNDASSACSYEIRNFALRRIFRFRRLAKEDVGAMLAYLSSHDANMRVERVAALKNDVINLLRKQEPPVEGLAETLIAMIEGRPVAWFGRSGRAGVPPPAADGDGTPSLESNGCCE